MNSKICFVLAICINLLTVSCALFAQSELSPRYRRRDVLESRFGDSAVRARLAMVEEFRKRAEKNILGQERVIAPLVERLESYARGFKDHGGKPWAAHLLGFDGLGQDLIPDLLEQSGFQVIRVDGRVSQALPLDLLEESPESEVRPVILFIDALEQRHLRSDETKPQQGSSLLGQVRALLNDGSIIEDRFGAARLSGSHFFVLTSLPLEDILAQRFIESLGREAAESKRSSRIESLSIGDRVLLDSWIHQLPDWKASVLSSSLPSDSVKPFKPNVLLMKPLSEDDYRNIISAKIIEIEKRLRDDEGGYEAVEFDPSIVDFVLSRSVGSVLDIGELKERIEVWVSRWHRLGQIAVKRDSASSAKATSLSRPRSLKFSWDRESTSVRIAVTELRKDGKALKRESDFSVVAHYDADSEFFYLDKKDQGELTASLIEEAKSPPRKPLKKEISAARRSTAVKTVRGLAKFLKQNIRGIGDLAGTIEDELLTYMSRPGSSIREPSALALQGLTGTGKSTIFLLIAKYLGLPFVQINLKNFRDQDSTTVTRFIDEVRADVSQMRKKRPDGKYLILFDELDKLAEKDSEGEFVDRPVMGVLNDILGEGLAGITRTAGDGESDRGGETKVNLRAGFVAFTLNFGNQNLGFSADPRLTSINDIRRVVGSLQDSPTDRDQALKTIFGDETIRRVFPVLRILQSPAERDYREIVARELVKEIEERFSAKSGPFEGKNISGVTVVMTKAYQDFVFSESVIPSQGPGGAVNTARGWLRRQLELALSRLPANPVFQSEPLELVLDFIPQTSEFLASAQPKDGSLPLVELTRNKVNLNFPTLQAFGPITEDRKATAIHELGHAYAMVRLGVRFSEMLSAQISGGTLGFVSHRVDHGKDEPLSTLRAEIVELFVDLASRAMERIFLSEDPREPISRLSITMGSTRDLEMATELISFLTHFGADLDGGNLARDSQKDYFSLIPDEQLRRAGLVLRDLENFIVDDFLKAHSKAWFAKKIQSVASRGQISERGFYRLIGYSFPGENTFPIGDLHSLRDTFGSAIKDLPESVRVAREFLQGRTRTTAAQNLRAYVDVFQRSLRRHLHPNIIEGCSNKLSALK